MIPVFPITYFGSLLYYQQLAKHQQVLIEAKEHFPKQSYRNRCDIVGADGILSLSIPVKKPHGSKTHTDKVELALEENWRMRHWRSIRTAYQSAAFFDYYGMEIEELLFSEEDNLMNFNLKITQRILSWLDLDIELVETQEFQPVIENDPREVFVNKNLNQEFLPCPYIQVFSSSKSFTKNVSILDTILCEGPLARNLILNPHD